MYNFVQMYINIVPLVSNDTRHVQKKKKKFLNLHNFYFYLTYFLIKYKIFNNISRISKIKDNSFRKTKERNEFGELSNLSNNSALKLN